jgi:hypothetical protein
VTGRDWPFELANMEMYAYAFRACLPVVEVELVPAELEVKDAKRLPIPVFMDQLAYGRFHLGQIVHSPHFRQLSRHSK